MPLDWPKSAERLNDHMPAQYMAHFNRVGRSLLDGETIEITATDKSAACLTQKSREVLVRHSGGEMTRNTTIRGAVSEADLKNMVFRLEPIYGTSARCPLPGLHEKTVIEALDGYRNDEDPVRVLVQATGVYDIQNRLQRVESVQNVELLDPLDVDAILDEFCNLHDGWLEDGGVAPDHAGLDWLSDIFGQYYPSDIQLPHTYPTADGGVSLEWSFGVRDVDIEVNLKDHTGEWCVFNRDIKLSEESKRLPLNEADSWKWASLRLRELAEQP